MPPTADRPGLAPERTALAWQRTAMGCGLLGAGVLKLGLARDRLLEWVAASWLLALAALLGSIAWQRRRTGEPPSVASRRQQLRAVTGTMVLAAVLVIAALINARS